MCEKKDFIGTSQRGISKQHQVQGKGWFGLCRRRATEERGQEKGDRKRATEERGQEKDNRKKATEKGDRRMSTGEGMKSRLDEKEMGETREYVIFAGVNGAGKTTFYHTFDGFPANRVNADEIVQENGGDWRNPLDQAYAMREAVQRIKRYLENGDSFNQETTLAGGGIINTVMQAKERGYEVKMFYIGLESADLAVERVADRVRKGGHGVAETDIRRRYGVSLRTLPRIIPLCDRVEVFDNTQQYDCVAVYEKGTEVFRKECGWYGQVKRQLCDGLSL